MNKGRRESRCGGKWMIPVSSTVPQSIQATIPSSPPFPAPPQQGGLDPISSTIASLNTNPYLIGMFMLLLNLGGRFLSLELTKKQEAFLQSPVLRPLLFFTVIFIATRNLAAAFWVTLLLFFILWVAVNENSPFCMIPEWCGHETKNEHENYTNNVKKMMGLE